VTPSCRTARRPDPPRHRDPRGACGPRRASGHPRRHR
ncbi:MAG: hypothetical protein AVDCRST_MAG32-2824, partial [uncultured Nocardioides sp.]